MQRVVVFVCLVVGASLPQNIHAELEKYRQEREARTPGKRVLSSYSAYWSLIYVPSGRCYMNNILPYTT